MAPIAAFLAGLVYVFDFLTGSSRKFDVTMGSLQIPVPEMELHFPQATNYPIIIPPDDLEPNPFQCEYPSYSEDDGWVACNNNTNRDCWFKNTKTGQRFDINTDYESNGPRGIIRRYFIELTDSSLNTDGNGTVPVQLFNGSLPGPRIQACWGDRVEITIQNSLKENGTAIHWHGLRQWKSGHMDGVNAVTQCPIPPGTQFTYGFNMTQYGTTWYHSHYSLQYAAGLLGPLTIYGPTSANYDHQVSPIIMSDWLHQSVFEEWDLSVTQGSSIYIDNILQNGIGHWPPDNLTNANFNEVIFQKGVKYLLRLINGAADTTFVFSIDSHQLCVISTDFVAITPYCTDHVVVGIGQRYNIIVEANPANNTADQNFWIRTSPAPGCTHFNKNNPAPDERTGIVRYTVNTDLPTTSRGTFDVNCADETYFRNITPIVPWSVSQTRNALDTFYLSDDSSVEGFPYWPCNKKNFHFELVSGNPMWLNFSAPALLNLDMVFPNNYAEITTPELNADQWVQLTVLSGSKSKKRPDEGRPLPEIPGVHIPSQHPIHLHGHDFAILDQCVPQDEDDTGCSLNNATINLDNPPRRDVAFLANGGYLILAFKADNPGVWIMHCHIAFHASLGLAAQIIENKAKIPDFLGLGWDDVLVPMCLAWDEWTPTNSSDPCMTIAPDLGKEPLQEDSGI